MASCFRRIIWEFYHLEIRLTDLWMVDRWLGGLAHTVFMVCNSAGKCVFFFWCGAFVKRVNHVLAFPKCYPKTDPTARIWRQGMVFPPRQCRSQWAFGTICCARWCGSAFAQQPGHFGVLARTMNKFLMSWSLISMIVFHAACAFDTIYSHFLFGSLSLSLCIYISPHVFDSNGWFISIHKSCLWECSIHLTDICETLLLMFCQDMIGHLFHLCIETFGLPADVDSQPLDVTLFRTANITRWPGYKRNISYKTYINHICFFFN